MRKLLLALFFIPACTYSIEFSAVPMKQSYHMGEDIQVTLTIANDTDERVAVPIVMVCETFLYYNFSPEPRDSERVRLIAPIFDLQLSEENILWLFPGGKFRSMININDCYQLQKGSYSISYALLMYQSICDMCEKYYSMGWTVLNGVLQSNMFTIEIIE